MNCPNCKRESPDRSEFCHHCGTDLPRAKEAGKKAGHETTLAGIKCPKCAAANPLDALLCGLCGHPLQEIKRASERTTLRPPVPAGPAAELQETGPLPELQEGVRPSSAASSDRHGALVGLLMKCLFLAFVLGGGYFAWDFIRNYGSLGVTTDSPLGELPLLEKDLLGRGFTQEAAEGDGLTLRYSCKNGINPTDFKDVIIITTDGEGRVMGVGGTFLSSWNSAPSEGTGGCRFLAELWKQAVMRDLNLVKGVEGSGIFAVQVKQEFCQEEKIGGHWKLAQIGGGLSSFGATEVKLFRNE